MKSQSQYVDREPTRRRFADELRRLATGRRFTPRERAEFARLADVWERTVTAPTLKR